MALKKNEQLLLDSILQTADIIKGMVGNDINMINEKLAEMLKGFYDESQKKLILSIDEQGAISARVADYKSDFVRTRYNTDSSMLSLKGKINGVPIDVKVVKDDVSFTNKEVAESLAELAGIVAKMPVEMSAHGHDDWPREAGSMPKKLSSSSSEEFNASDESPESEEEDGDYIIPNDLELPEPETSGEAVESEQDAPETSSKPVRRTAMSLSLIHI